MTISGLFRNFYVAKGTTKISREKLSVSKTKTFKFHISTDLITVKHGDGGMMILAIF